MISEPKDQTRRGGIWAASAAALACFALSPFALAGEDVIYTVIDGVGISDPLTDVKPNPDRGGVIYLDPDRGRCSACHGTASLPVQDQPAAGPDLDGVADRLSVAELRLLVVNPKILRPDAAMPAYFNVSVEDAIRAPDAPQPALTAREVEDVVAFLRTLSAD